MTPQQMRELADVADNLTRDSDWDAAVIADVMSTLRAAADQLEALHEWDMRGRFENLDAILTADTAPNP